MVKVTELTKHFHTVMAVDRVTFQAQPGEIFGLLGENGAGKTTTMRMLATLLEPTSGTALVNGVDLRQDPQGVRAQLGVLFEGGVYDRLTARENIRYFGRLYQIPSRELETRIDELIRFFRMEEFAERRAGKLSKGMRQKVALARILVHDPPILILDEPTSGLDVTSARIVHDFIAKSKSEGKTVIVSSHNMDEVEKLCDRVAIIHKGKIVENADMDEMKRKAGGASLEELFVRLVGERI